MTKTSWKEFKTKYMKNENGKISFRGSNIDFFNVFKQYASEQGKLETAITKTVDSDIDEGSIDIFKELTNFLKEGEDGISLESTNGVMFDSWKAFLVENGSPSNKYEEHLQECIEWVSPTEDIKLELSFDEVDVDDYDPTEKDCVLEAKKKAKRNIAMNRGHLELIDAVNDEVIFSFSNNFMSRSEKEQERNIEISIPKSKLEPKSIVDSKKGTYVWTSLCDNYEMLFSFDFPEQPKDDSIISKKTYHTRMLFNQKLGSVIYRDKVNDRVIFEFDNAEAASITSEHIEDQKRIVSISGQDMMPKYTYDQALSKTRDLESNRKKKTESGLAYS